MRQDAVRCQYMELTNRTKSNRLYVSHCFKVVFIQSGRALWEIGGARYDVAPGDIVLLGNQEERRLQDIGADEAFRCLVLECEPSFLFATPLLPLFLGPHRHAARRCPGTPEAMRLLRRIEEEDRARGPFYETVVAAAFLQLLALLARGIGLPAQGVPCPDEGLAAVLREIDARYTSPLPLADLAAAAHMSRSRFCAQFARCVGISPTQYILRKRVGRAIELLESGEESVLDIALQCGFNTSANFYAVFRKLTACSPSDFRRAEP